MEDRLNLIYVRFDKSLDYKAVVNSYPVKKFCEFAFGEFPKFISPTKFTFDRDKLGKYVQKMFDKSEEYIIDSECIPQNIAIDYLHANGYTSGNVWMYEFEPELLLDDHVVVLTYCNTVLGVIASEFDFEKIIGEL